MSDATLTRHQILSVCLQVLLVVERGILGNFFQIQDVVVL